MLRIEERQREKENGKGRECGVFGAAVSCMGGQKAEINDTPSEMRERGRETDRGRERERMRESQSEMEMKGERDRWMKRGREREGQGEIRERG